MIPLSYADQIVEGSFERALNEIVEEHLDLTVFEKRYANDETGRPAYDPRVLLKVVLYGYYKGILSSRMLAEACRRNVVFMALSADTRPHFTTLAGFVSELDREIVGLFRRSGRVGLRGASVGAATRSDARDLWSPRARQRCAVASEGDGGQWLS
jgi:transposase